MEMILCITHYKQDPNKGTGSIFPLAFPMNAGAGTLTTILSLRAVYAVPNLLIGIIINLAFVYLVLKTSNWLERKIGEAGFNVLRRVFGIILLAIAVKIFKDNISL
jgi:multiple antibiotic resistance protein